ncbi:MAG: tetratricopeptide repeat protein [Bacteroidota bacterium]
MKPLIYFFAASLVLFSSLFAQPAYPDSIKQRLAAQAVDSTYFSLLTDLCEYWYGEREGDSLRQYAQQLKRSASQKGAISHLGQAHDYLTSAARWQGAYEEAALHCDSAIAFFQQIDQQRPQMRLNHLKGMIRSDQGRYEDAIAAYYDALDLAMKEGDSLSAGNILNGVGWVQSKSGNQEQAEKDYLRGLDLLESKQGERRRALVLNGLGSLYYDEERFEEAVSRYEEAIEIFRKKGIKGNEVAVKANLARCLMKMGKNQKVLPLLEENVAYWADGAPIYHADALAMLADAHYDLGHFRQAETFYRKSLQINQEIGAEENQRRDMVNLAEALAGSGQHEAAYGLLQQARLLNNTLYNQELAQEIATLTETFEAEKREAEITLLTTQNELQDAALKNEAYLRWGLIAGLILLGLLAWLIWVNQQRKLSHERQLAENQRALDAAQFQQQRTDLELKALRAQMNPHFVFNSMNSINRLILEDKNEQAPRNLSKFARLIRQILEFSEKKHITLAEELDMLNTYVALENQRFSGQIDFEVSLAPELDPDDIEVPSMLLQPFVENAIWHGIMHKESGSGRIALVIAEENEKLHCRITDNGVGREQALRLKKQSAPSHQSMAMMVTEERLRLMADQGEESLIEIIDLEDASGQASGTEVNVVIPM